MSGLRNHLDRSAQRAREQTIALLVLLGEPCCIVLGVLCLLFVTALRSAP